MELNLRKARKLDSKLDKLIGKLSNDLETEKSVRVNADIQSEVLPELVQARKEFLSSFENINELIDARFQVRKLISDQNESSGINNKINQKVNLESKLSKVNLVINRFNYLDEKELEDDSQRYKTMLTNGDRFGRSTFSASFLLSGDAGDFQNQQVSFQKEIEKIEDDLLDLNSATKIKLSNELVSLLQSNNLL